MNFVNSKKKCPKCGKLYDDCQVECHHCHTLNRSKNIITENSHVFWMNSMRQGMIFLVGFLGFNFLALIFSMIFRAIGKSITTTPEELTAFLNSNQLMLLLNFICYLIVFIGILIIIFPFLNVLFKEFKKGRTWLWGVLGGIALIASSLAIGLIIGLLRPDTDVNQNQASIEAMAKLYPLPCILLFGIVGPVVEEFTYRVGAYSWLKRWNKIGAYIVTILVFGLIHFNFNTTTSEELINELINIPTYIIAGGLLCYIYERSSWAGSSLAHIINNLYGVIIIIIQAHLA